MIKIQLALEFFKIGLFSFGGGYATIPFLYHISQEYGWYTLEELKRMVAIASITPGPIGINVATFAGLKTAGILGAVLATISEMLPSLLLVILVAKFLKEYSDDYYVKSSIETLKPVSCALLLSVVIDLLKPQLGDIKALVLLFFLLLISYKSKKDPIIYMLIAGVVGIIMRVFS